MDIKKSPSGMIIKSSKGYDAFIPHVLPPKFEWDNNTLNSLSRADFLLGKLSREGSQLPNPHLLMRPFIAREAVLSSKIEGTQATLGEILAANAGVDFLKSPDDLQEVQNYIKALDFGLKRLEEIPLSLRLIKEIHNELMKNVRGSNLTPGEFRRSQNWIGSPGCTLNTAKFVPPTPDHLMECLGHFETFLHDRQWPPLIHIAFCHYQFEAIHPFLDGNGRIGRLLIALLLIERKMMPSPLLYLSAFFEATRDTYYQHLYNVSSKGSWNEWLIYFLNGVAVQSFDVLSRAERINNLIQKWKMMVASHSSSVNIVLQLAVNPYFTIKKMSEELNVAYSTTQRGVQKLEALDIVTQTNNNKRDKVYCAVEILNILEEPTKMRIEEDD